MAKLRKPLPFPFASARERRVHQIRTEFQPSIGGSKPSHSNAMLGHLRGRYPICVEHNGEAEADEAEADEASPANEAFFGDYGRLHPGQLEGAETQHEDEGEGQLRPGKMRRKTPALRLKKKVQSLDLDIFDGLITPPTRPRMRIRSLNSKCQTSPSGDDAAPAQSHLAIDLRLALLFSTVYLVVLFMLYPTTTLDLSLMVLMFFAPFPEWMPWWTTLLAMVLPMGLQARFEVTVFLCLVVWLGGLEWGEAWRRVVRWVWDA